MKIFNIVLVLLPLLFLSCNKEDMDPTDTQQLNITVKSSFKAIRTMSPNAVDFEFYPNPFGYNVTFENRGSANLEKLVFSYKDGRMKIMDKAELDSLHGRQINLDFQDCPTGVYYCELQFSNGVVSCTQLLKAF